MEEKLVNGQTVRAGTLLVFTNSDGVECVEEVQEANGRLYFWNSGFTLQDYPTARIYDPRTPLHNVHIHMMDF